MLRPQLQIWLKSPHKLRRPQLPEHVLRYRHQQLLVTRLPQFHNNQELAKQPAR